MDTIVDRLSAEKTSSVYVGNKTLGITRRWDAAAGEEATVFDEFRCVVMSTNGTYDVIVTIDVCNMMQTSTQSNAWRST